MKIDTLFDHKETIVIYKESMGHANDYQKIVGTTTETKMVVEI
jgi:hypothetical protein